MNGDVIQILLIESNLATTHLIQKALSEISETQFKIKHVGRLEDGLGCLAAGASDIDMILLDLSLADEQGLNAVTLIRAVTDEVPIIVLTTPDNLWLAAEALSTGAQAY